VAHSVREIRALYLLQVAIVCLVVVVCMLGLSAADGDFLFAGPTFLAILIALGAIGVSSWITYRAAKRMLMPVDWLLQQVGSWDPRQPDTRALSPERIPDVVQGDARKMADALHGLGERVDAFVARERDFTRDASHELRTPLTVVRMAAELISGDDGLSDRSRRSLARIQAANATMESLMEALLLLARDESVRLESEDFSVRDIVEEELEKARVMLEGREVSLHAQFDDAPELHAPPRVLKVMLGNLLSNAVRFTDEGSIRVRVASDRLVVEDTGIGMAAAELARAFEPFYRADASQVGGGLGLSIAHRLGRRCGWPLQLESVPGEGTRATILFGTCIQPD
jgi:signal transduction histidine kinase